MRSKISEEHLFCGKSSLNRVFKRVIASDMSAFIINFYANVPLPSVFIKMNTTVPGFIGCALKSISHILGLGRLSEINPSVVKSISIYVIYSVFWPMPRHHRPRNSMGLVDAAIYSNENAPVCGFASSNISSPLAPPRRTFPNKIPGFGVIFKYAMEIFYFNHAENLPRNFLAVKMTEID